MEAVDEEAVKDAVAEEEEVIDEVEMEEESEQRERKNKWRKELQEFEGELSDKNIEIGVIGTDRTFRVLTPAEIKDYLDEVE